jgi:hypothetical protein
MPFGKKKSEAKSPEAVFSQPYQSAKADTASGDFDKIGISRSSPFWAFFDQPL